MDTPVTIWLPPMTLHSALRHILDSIGADAIGFTVRDEVLLITTKQDEEESAKALADKIPASSPTAGQDTGELFVESWLKRASKQADDKIALRNALKEHLEQEFDDNLQARQVELLRLEKLLERSRQWLDTRNARRDEIVNQRLEELLQDR